MQRRAAALYAAFFIVLAVGSYSVIGAASEPTVSLDDPEYTLAAGDTLTIDGREYEVPSLGEGSAELAWVDEDARQTETWDAGAAAFEPASDGGPGVDRAVDLATDGDLPTATLDGVEYRVVVRDSPGDPARTFLVESIPIPDNVTTQEVDGSTYVVAEDDGGPDLVPFRDWVLDNYDRPDVRTLEEGDRFLYSNRTVGVDAVNNGSVVIAWTAPQENTVSASEGANVTLNGRQFVAHFPDAATLELESNLKAYQDERRVVEYYDERISGLWGVSILSSLAAIAILGFAYLPSRY